MEDAEGPVAPDAGRYGRIEDSLELVIHLGVAVALGQVVRDQDESKMLQGEKKEATASVSRVPFFERPAKPIGYRERELPFYQRPQKF